jgi:hypothetical protein
VDPYYAKISNCFKRLRDSNYRLSVLGTGAKRAAKELNVIKLLQKVRLSMGLLKV